MTPESPQEGARADYKWCACGCGTPVPPAIHKGIERAYASAACRAKASRERRGPRRKPAGEGRLRSPRHEVQMPDELWAWVGERAGVFGLARSDYVVAWLLHARQVDERMERGVQEGGRE